MENTENLHAHFESRQRDCDGTYDHAYVIVMNDDERASEFGDIQFHDRVASTVGDFYASDFGGVLTVVRTEDDSMRFSWRADTEEGFVNREAYICTDECDEAATLYRDHTAEEAGY